MASSRHASRRAFLAGAASAVVLGSTGLMADAVGITPAPRPRGTRRTPAATLSAPVGATQATLSSSSSVAPGQTHAWDGLEPTLTSKNTWVFELPASATPPSPRRSEAWWTVDGALRSYGEGDLVVFQAEVMGELGAAAFSTQDWHLLWQLQGPVRGNWGPPVLDLAVNGGYLNLQGGDGHPNHRPGVTGYWWRKNLAPFTNGRYYKIRIEVLVSADPTKGWVSVWVDGTRVLDRWKPVSSSGYRPATLYPGQPAVNSRSALYRGTFGNAPRPTYDQRTYQRNIAIH